jgi:hypothetical protein
MPYFNGTTEEYGAEIRHILGLAYFNLRQYENAFDLLKAEHGKLLPIQSTILFVRLLPNTQDLGVVCLLTNDASD